jgi:cholesterol transport system auxiliary component
MRLKPILRHSTSLCLILSLSACSLAPVPLKPVNHYALTQVTLKPSPKTSAATLTLVPVIATRGFDSTAMIYQSRPYQFAAFAENVWNAPPANMLTTLFFQGLEQSRQFKSISLAPSTTQTTYTLTPTLLSLYQDFTVTPSEIVLSLNLSLSDNKTHQVISNKTLMLRVKTEANTPYAGVVAANKAADLAVGQMSVMLQQSIPFIK